MIALVFQLIEVKRHWDGLGQLSPPVVELLLVDIELSLQDFKGIGRSHVEAHLLKSFDHCWEFCLRMIARRMNVIVYELI